MATLLVFLWLVVGLYYSSPSPVPIQSQKQKEIKPISAGTWYIQENIVHHEDKASSDLQLYYTSNMAVMMYDSLKEIEEAEVRDVSLFAEPVKYDPVEIDQVDVKT